MRPTLAQLDMATLAIRTLLPLTSPADTLLRLFFRNHPMMGQNDRAIIAEIVFGILRHRFFLECLTEKATPRALLVAYLVKFEGMNLRELATFINESEAKWLAHIKAITLASQPLAIQAEFPEWLMAKLQKFLPDNEILRLGQALQQPAPLDLRVNTLLAKRDEILAVLRQQGIEAHATPYSPVGVRLTGKPAINKDFIYRFSAQYKFCRYQLLRNNVNH